MASDFSADFSAPPNLNLNTEEKRVYGQLFRQADTESVGVVTGDVAVKFFDKTRLDSRVLGEIWQIADSENRGFLTPAGFGIVLRLIGHAQAGREPSPEIALLQGPIPRFDGLGPPLQQQQPTSSLGSPTTAVPLQAQGTGGGGGIRVPPLTPDKVAQYTGLFERQPLQANKLPGEQARNIFDKSGLPNEILGRIWALADTEQRGALVLPEFVIAMHLLTSLKTGALRSLPPVLPAGLYEAATSRAVPHRQSPSNTGINPLPRQLSGQAGMRTGSPLGRTATGAQPSSDWAISPADKAKFDHIYAGIDKTNKGYITGEEAVPFLSQSNLSEDALAQIWDLADFNSQGQLNRDGFAVAMFLIRQQRSGAGGPLPSTLPPNLVPPSVRNQRQPPTPFPPPVVATAAASRPPPPPAPKSALDDLFGLDAAPAPAPAPTQITMSTGDSANDPFGAGSAVLSPSMSPAQPTSAAAGGFKPFVPSSTFGRGLAGPSTTAGSPKPAEDLLEDNDPDATKLISGETTELANLSSQIGTLSTQMQEVQNKRTTTQAELNQTNSQKQNFEQRLAQLRALYEREAEATRSLEDQLRKSRADTQKLQSECLTLEGTYRDVQAQHQQIREALRVDQQENSNLRERIRVVNGEIAQLKPQIEKLKSEARQQKGLVAINKKQLATTEGERDKLKNEVETLAKEEADLSRQVASGSPAPAAAAQVASPALSTSSANNPFFKRTASTDIMGAFASPVPPSRSYNDKSFDDVFGPSFASTGSGPPASSPHPQSPAALQQQQHTGTSAASAGSLPNTGRSSPNVSRASAMNVERPASRHDTSGAVSAPFPEKTDTLSRQGTSATLQSDVPEPASTAEDHEKIEISDSLPVAAPLGEVAPQAKKEEPSDAAKEVDSFGSTDQAKAKADFDNAFAAFTASGKSKPMGDSSSAQAKPVDAFNSEFPPITELADDSDSDSDSERGGFDDDFAPASPPTKDGKRKDSLNIGNGTRPNEPSSNASAPVVPAKEPVEEAAKSTDDSSSPVAVTNSVQPAMTADDIFGTAGAASLPASTMLSVPAAAMSQTTVKPTAEKGVFDDLDDDFEGLEDAKEGSADDDFANISRDDFNPVFDHSPPASQAKSESTAFGNESTFDFVSHSSAAGSTVQHQPQPQPQPQQQQQKTADTHDWDALFAGLDEAAPATSSPGESGPRKGDLRPPPPGRALTEQGEHDDPILKSLTSMGYSRSDAVASLEKYDYNLEKAANYLASKS